MDINVILHYEVNLWDLNLHHITSDLCQLLTYLRNVSCMLFKKDFKVKANFSSKWELNKIIEWKSNTPTSHTKRKKLKKVDWNKKTNYMDLRNTKLPRHNQNGGWYAFSFRFFFCSEIFRFFFLCFHYIFSKYWVTLMFYEKTNMWKILLFGFLFDGWKVG